MGNNGIMKVFLFLGLLYAIDMAKKAGFISIPVQIAIIVVLMVFFLFGKKIIARFKK